MTEGIANPGPCLQLVRTMRPASGVSLIVIATLIAAGCAGVEVMSPPPWSAGATGTGATGGAGGGTAPQALLIGTWTRAIYVEGLDGDLHESRTTWVFRSDGSATRTVRAWNISEGIYDVVVDVASWRVANGALTVTWVAPQSGSASFPLTVRQDLLQLGNEQYARVQ